MYGAPMILPKDLPKKKAKTARKRKAGATAKKTGAKRTQRTRTKAT